MTACPHLSREVLYEISLRLKRIGKNPTPRHNRYFVMKWDFSLVKAQGDVKEIEAALHQHLNDCIQEVAQCYQDRLPYPIQLHADNALSSWRSALMAVSKTDHCLCLLIDEYDNFANDVPLAALPEIERALQTAGEQARRYGAALSAQYGLTDLRLFAVVGIELEWVV